jgi:phage terminase large subunit
MLATAPAHDFATVFRPLPWQVEPWRCKRRVMLLTGSAGGGKSYLAAHKLHAYCLKYPGAMALMLRKTRESMTNSTVLFVDRAIIAGATTVTHYPSKHRFEYSNGSILAYGGMADDQQREQIRSIGQDGSVDVVWMEEATGFTENDYNEVTARIRGKAASWRQIVLTTNPDTPSHWIYKRLIQGGEAAVFYSGATDNTYNPLDYIDTLASLTGVLGLRLRDGQWIQAEGAVYDEFSDAVHVVDTYDETQARNFIAGVDWGFTNPGVIHVYAEDGDGRLVLVHEVYQTRRLIDWWVEQAKALRSTYGVTAFHCDPAEPAYIEQFQQAGLPAVAATNDIRPGIDAVKQRLKVAGDGRPRLQFLRSARRETDSALEFAKRPLGVLDEITAYVWPKGADGKPVKEVPVDDNNHGLDSLRYAVMGKSPWLMF